MTSPSENVLARLQDVRPAGEGFVARCPAHDDRRASLTVGAGDDGRVLLHCQTGCPPERVVDALGLEMRDLFPPRQVRERIVETYDYTDERGQLLFQVVRKEPKGFAQRRPEGSGGWLWNLRDVRRVLFRLPFIMTADPKRPIYVPEGERDVLALETMGFLATTNPGGAGKWRPEYGEALRGRRVVLLPDNDSPGRDHAEAVASALHGVASVVKIVLLPGLPQKGDVSDWLATGGTNADLTVLAKEAPIWAPPSTDHIGQNGHNTPHQLDIGHPGHSGQCVDAPWELITPLDESPAPAFPIDLLTSWQGDFVNALSEATQTPPDLAASMTQDAIAAAVSKKVAVRVREGWQEPLNRYGVVALGSGERKTPVHQAVIAPIEEFQRVRVAQDAKAIARMQTERNIALKTLERAEKEAAAADPTKREAKRLAALAEAERAASLTVPASLCLLADDISPEKVAAVLSEQGGRLAILSDEGGIFDMMAGRYAKSGASPNLDVFLKGHSGGTVSVKRVGRPDDFVPAAALTIGLAVQPAVIAGLAEHAAFRGRGLLARFAYAMPASRLGRRATKPAPVPEAVHQAYRAQLMGLLAIPVPIEPHLLQLSSEADAALSDFEAELEPRLGEHGDLAQIADWAGKLVGLTVRHAGQFHLADHAADREPWASPVQAETMERAIRLSRDYLIPHALAAFALMGADPAVTGAKHLLRWIGSREIPTAPFTKRDAWRATRGRFHRANQIDEPLIP